MQGSYLRLTAVLAVSLAVSSFAPVLAQPASSDSPAYRKPPASIQRILDTRPTPSLSLSPDRRHALMIERVSLPPIADLAQPMLRLAGTRVNPDLHGRFGYRMYDGLVLLNVETGDEQRVSLPENADLGSPRWAPDGSRFVITRNTPEGIELWAGDVSTATATRLPGIRVNGLAPSPRWLSDSRSLLCMTVPADLGAAPEASTIPTGPVIQSTSGVTAPVRTYQDLLQDAHDEALFDHYWTAQLVRVDVTTGESTAIGSPDRYRQVTPSPDGSVWLVSRIRRPYSYLVPTYLFPETFEVWSADGNRVAHLADLPLREAIPIGGVATGPRSYRWSETEPATLYWLEALDGGDPKAEVPHRDRLMRSAAPYTGNAEEVLRTEHRFSSVQWLAEGGLAMVSEYDRDRRWSRTWLTTLQVGAEPRLVWDRSVQDRYGDPGRPITHPRPDGTNPILVHDGAIYLSGRGAGPGGDRPFLDRMTLSDLSTQRLWQCGEGVYETLTAMLGDGGDRIVIQRQAPTVVPNYHVLDLGTAQSRALTSFADPFPELHSIHKELVTYERADGVPLSATLYLPPDYKEGERRPLLLWAYPREYNDARTAGQVSGSPYRFTRLAGSSHLFLLTQGYAILDGAAMPVIGDPETVNDTFIQQIVDAAQAGIDKAVEMGVADRDRVAVAGHSYGAFMTANLLAHCDLFRTGIARSGAYNRTLTPFGFQSERRTFWEAPMSYFKLSPFMHANKINEPILLIHGQVDNNSGTFPMQSERMYHALKGHGAHARLIMLPHESHGYRARESVEHVLAETVEWLDRHLKNAPAMAPSAASGGGE